MRGSRLRERRRRSFFPRSSAVVDGDCTSHTQSGASEKYASSGRCGSRSRRQAAISGTSTSAAKCSSGSKRMRHPPGPPRPRSNGHCSKPTESARSECMTRSWPRRRVKLAIDDLRDEMLRHCHQIVVGGWPARRRRHAVRIALGVHQDDDGIVLRGRSRWQKLPIHLCCSPWRLRVREPRVPETGGCPAVV